MKNENFTVKTADNDEWSFNAEVVENYEEAEGKYGEAGAFEVFMAGLRVKLRNIGRDSFRKGKSQEEVETDVDA